MSENKNKEVRKTVVFERSIDEKIINYIADKRKYDRVPYSALVRQAFKLLMDQDKAFDKARQEQIDVHKQNEEIKGKKKNNIPLFKGYRD